jgi:hypothetical protein
MIMHKYRLTPEGIPPLISTLPSFTTEVPSEKKIPIAKRPVRTPSPSPRLPTTPRSSFPPRPPITPRSVSKQRPITPEIKTPRPISPEIKTPRTRPPSPSPKKRTLPIIPKLSLPKDRSISPEPKKSLLKRLSKPYYTKTITTVTQTTTTITRGII